MLLGIDSKPAAITEMERQLQGALRCGTQCGSCVPELRRLVREQVPALA